MKRTIEEIPKRKIPRCRYWNCPNNHKKENNDGYFVILCDKHIKERDAAISAGYSYIVRFWIDLNGGDNVYGERIKIRLTIQNWIGSL